MKILDLFSKKKQYYQIFLLVFLGLVILLSISPDVMAQASVLSNDEIHELYEEGKEYFREANMLINKDQELAQETYQKAALRFERIVKEGHIQSGKLYYNIGNIYFRMKDVGRAILNYRRAQQYIPNDPNLHQNLQFARDKRLDSVDEKQKTKILKTLFFWHYDFSTRLKSLIFIIGFVGGWLLALVHLFLRKRFLIYMTGAAALCSMCFLGSLFVEQRSHQIMRPGVVLASELVARKGDSIAYEPSFLEPIHAGTEFLLLENRADWLHVELADGRRCWVPSNEVELVR